MIYAQLVLLIIANLQATDAQQSRGDPASLYAEGSKHFDLGEYDQAIEAFEAAYRLSHEPALLFNIAQAYRLKGPPSCGDALGYYERYLEQLPTTPHRAEIQERIDQMRQCVEERRATQTAPPPRTPSQAFVTPPPPPTPPQGSLARTFGWTAIGVGAAGVALATVTAVMLASKHDDLERQCHGGVCPPSLQGDVDDYKLLRNVSTTASIVGAVGLGAGLILLWRAPSAPRTRATAEPWLGTRGFGVRGTF
jgi:tetratricopeptide (TPR) repeat protein